MENIDENSASAKLDNKQRAYAATLMEPMHDITQEELDSYLIEAALRSEDAGTAASLINRTRVLIIFLYLYSIFLITLYKINQYIALL